MVHAGSNFGTEQRLGVHNHVSRGGGMQYVYVLGRNTSEYRIIGEHACFGEGVEEKPIVLTGNEDWPVVEALWGSST